MNPELLKQIVGLLDLTRTSPSYKGTPTTATAVAQAIAVLRPLPAIAFEPSLIPAYSGGISIVWRRYGLDSVRKPVSLEVAVDPDGMTEWYLFNKPGKVQFCSRDIQFLDSVLKQIGDTPVPDKGGKGSSV